MAKKKKRNVHSFKDFPGSAILIGMTTTTTDTRRDVPSKVKRAAVKVHAQPLVHKQTQHRRSEQAVHWLMLGRLGCNALQKRYRVRRIDTSNTRNLLNKHHCGRVLGWFQRWVWGWV